MVWQQRERQPFAAGVDAGCDLIMTTHVVAPTFGRTIATGSATVVNELIRGNLGFDGPVITDDLTMKGAAELGDYGERAVRAFLAGHDMLMFCHDFELVVEAFENFAGAVEAGEITPDRIQAALDRIAGVKLKLGHPVPR
jgi:beta-N-acetylhexosaminidase